MCAQKFLDIQGASEETPFNLSESVTQIANILDIQRKQTSENSDLNSDSCSSYCWSTQARLSPSGKDEVPSRIAASPFSRIFRHLEAILRRLEFLAEQVATSFSRRPVS